MKRFQTAFLGTLTALLTAAAFAAGHLQPLPDNPPPKEPDSSASAVTLFMENGLWGARTGSGRVLLEPEWYHLQIMRGNLLAARKTGGDKSCGIITADGEQLTPFLYHSMEKIMPDVWKALLTGKETKLHLYHADGTRWAERAWDSCTVRDGQLFLTDGRMAAAVTPEQQRLRLNSWHSEHAVGLHTLTADFSAEALENMPDMDTLEMLGDTAAAYLVYLFVTPETPPEISAFSGNFSELLVSDLYQNCTFETGEITEIREQETEGFPAYDMRILVHYAGIGADSQRHRYDTAMNLTITRNASGAYTYSQFEDIRFRIMNGSRNTIKKDG